MDKKNDITADEFLSEPLNLTPLTELIDKLKNNIELSSIELKELSLGFSDISNINDELYAISQKEIIISSREQIVRKANEKIKQWNDVIKFLKGQPLVNLMEDYGELMKETKNYLKIINS